jgi:hypothetical protein
MIFFFFAEVSASERHLKRKVQFQKRWRIFEFENGFKKKEGGRAERAPDE